MPVAPATEVPIASAAGPVIGEPGTGAVPTKAILSDPEDVTNCELIVELAPLLKIENVGFPIADPV